MHLRSADGRELDLAILGYQFPHLNDYDDGNWLNVRVRVTDPRGSWERSDPCLMTFEAAELAVWLEAVAVEAPMINRSFSKESGRPPEGVPLRLFDSAEFLEPNLRFELIARADNDAVIRVYFELELRPPWAPVSWEGGPEEAWMDFRVSPTDLKAAAKSLRVEVAGYPIRGVGRPKSMWWSRLALRKRKS